MPIRPTRVNLGSGSEYEAAAGYSRAVRVGPLRAVAGTTGSGDDVVACSEAFRVSTTGSDPALTVIISAAGRSWFGAGGAGAAR